LDLNFTAADWAAVAPHLILAGTVLVVMLADLLLSAMRSRAIVAILAGLSLVGVVAAGLVALWGPVGGGAAFGGMVATDPAALYVTETLLIGGALVLLVSAPYIERVGMAHPGEFFALALAALLGMLVLGTAAHFMTLFLGLEMLSLALYVLAGFAGGRHHSREAAIKYFLLSSFATGFLLYGIALLYGVTGHTGLADVGAGLRTAAQQSGGGLMMLAGVGLVAGGLAVKVSAVPGHMWTPDVYQGAPAPVTLLMAVGTKAAAFAAILRVFYGALGAGAAGWQPILYALAVLTMVGGNLLALPQRDFKRLLAYSSIAHAGYLLIGVVADTSAGAAGVLYYLLAYTVMNAGAFGVVAALEQADGSGVALAGLRGLAARRPWLALALFVSLVSLVGIPPLGGFFGKLGVFGAAVQAGHAELALLGVVMSAVSGYYYLRPAVALYLPALSSSTTSPPDRARWGSILAPVVAAAGTILLGLAAGPLYAWAAQAAEVLRR
jgi:NADH-quinone oxidoreductase subunit N